jgi:hypothetical protein
LVKDLEVAMLHRETVSGAGPLDGPLRATPLGETAVAAAEIVYLVMVIPADVVMASNLKSAEERALPGLILGDQILLPVAP